MSPPDTEIKRHYADLPPEDISEIIDVVAELIVTYLENRQERGQSSRSCSTEGYLTKK